MQEKSAKEHNNFTLYNWLQIMNQNKEKVFFSMARDEGGNLCLYTTLDNPEQIKDAIKHLLQLMNNSKEIIKL